MRKARHVGTKTTKGRRIVGTTNRRERTSPEVLIRKQNTSLVGRNALDGVAPPTRELDRRLPTLDSRVHGQDAIVAKVLRDEATVVSQGIVVEGSAGERQILGLIDESPDDLGMTVALIDGRVRAQEVKVLATVDVVELGAFSLGENDGKGLRQREIWLPGDRRGRY